MPTGSLLVGFLLALVPMLLILIGIAFFKQSGLRMAFVGWISAAIIAVAYFGTPIDVTLVGSVVGFLKGLGISVAVVVTMFMIFLMGAVGALGVISDRIKSLVTGAETQALYIGIAFGSFLTSLGVVTPALFPPLLVVMGFTPFAAVAIAVLGYNATTSFALLSIPITLPADQFGISSSLLAYKISIYLPVISVGLSFAILWMLGGVKSMKKGAVPAVIVGLAIALACLGLTGVNEMAGHVIVPVAVVGVFAGLIGMLALQIYERLQPPTAADVAGKLEAAGADGGAKSGDESGADDQMSFARAASPWIILTVVAIVMNIPSLRAWLSDLPGELEVLRFYENGIGVVDLNVLSQTYTAILVAVILSLPFLRPTREQLASATRTWANRSWSPFLAYSIYFCIAYVYLYSGRHEVDGALVETADFATSNMNVVIGSVLAQFFGSLYVYVAAWLGMFGAVVGGSETSSNVLFYPIQESASKAIGLTTGQFMTVFGAHAVAGGVASAITPAKLNNAVSAIAAGSDVEAAVMRKHLVITVLLTLATGLLTGLFVLLNI
ncbi:MAG: L-lactate permease [Anaerolineae bacterium]